MSMEIVRNGVASPVKWSASISGVRDVSLFGGADLDFWRRRLARERLEPADHDGRAKMIILSGELVFKGIRFRESSVAVYVQPPDKVAETEAVFLVQAFNSVRFFAFCERVFFSTPYRHAAVRVSIDSPIRVQVFDGGAPALHIEMSDDDGADLQATGERDHWEGPIFLPSSGKMFFSQVRGDGITRAFDADRDILNIKPTSGDGALRDLQASNFRGERWIVRPEAFHAKSKTYDRSKTTFR